MSADPAGLGMTVWFFIGLSAGMIGVLLMQRVSR